MNREVHVRVCESAGGRLPAPLDSTPSLTGWPRSAAEKPVRVEASGGLNYLEPMALNQALNRIRFKAMDYQYSIDILKAKLA
jgi:hypothetical protein